MTIDIKCPNCGFAQDVSEEKIPENSRWVKCPRCNVTFEFAEKKDETEAYAYTGFTRETGEPDHSPIIEEHGYFTDLGRTFASILFKPSSFFRGIKRSEGLKNPMAFGILTGSLGAMFSLFWQFYLSPEKLSWFVDLFPASISLNLLFIILTAVSPILVAINIFIVAGILHLFLMIVRGANNDFGETIKVSAYANAADIFCIIPLFSGSFISLVWGVIVTVIGLREIHETTTFRALMTFLIPLFLFIVFIIFIAFAAVFNMINLQTL